MSGDNYPIDFNISKNRISLIIHLRQKRHICNKKICLKNHSVIHLELLATYAILPEALHLNDFAQTLKASKKRISQSLVSSYYQGRNKRTQANESSVIDTTSNIT